MKRSCRASNVFLTFFFRFPSLSAVRRQLQSGIVTLWRYSAYIAPLNLVRPANCVSKYNIIVLPKLSYPKHAIFGTVDRWHENKTDHNEIIFWKTFLKVDSGFWVFAVNKSGTRICEGPRRGTRRSCPKFEQASSHLDWKSPEATKRQAE